MQDCQELDLNHSQCVHCESKDQALSKCMQLITLLKKKAKKYEDSKIRDSQSLSSNTVRTMPVNQHDLRGKLTLILIKQLEKKHIFSTFQALKRQNNMPKDSFHFCKITIEKDQKDMIFQIETSSSLNDIKVVKNDDKPVISHRHMEILQKNKMKNSFELMVENKRLGERVKFLELQLEDSLRRQDKEIAKKRQSLSGLVEELTEKNQMIDELKSNIKLLQSRLGAKENGILQCMLEEDSQALRKVVFRLENVNDKLNIDLEKIKKEKSAADAENKQYKMEIQALRSEIKQLKEQNFELEHDRLSVNASRKEIEFISHRISSKLERMRKVQKKWSLSNRNKDHMKHSEMDNILQSKLTKKASTECDSLALHQSASHFQEMQQKLEAVFIYLFHIDDLTFKLGSPQLFDEEEKELLSAHRQKYFQQSHHDSFIANKQGKNLDLDSSQVQFNPFGDSVIDALNEDLIVRQKCQTNDKKKAFQAELQSNKLIQKISQLKERNLYVRNVILSLFKTLELKSLKKQTEGILTMLSDYFQYSQTQRNQLFQSKSKKLFGFI